MDVPLAGGPRRLALDVASRRAAAGCLVLAALGAAAWFGMDHVRHGPTAVPTSSAEEQALGASQGFLGNYMEPDGRVVRSDQGGSTVSEGQAYAMLLAVAIGDHHAFDLAWAWARDHLQRPDGLLSYLWESGQVADPDPAADADLDAARALALAADRFDEPAYRQEARRIARAILDSETMRVGDRLVLVAGPWARTQPPTINPSYFDPRTFSLLGAVTGEKRWQEVLVSSREIAGALMDSGTRLPPDWARVEPRSSTASANPGTSGPPAYGFDAIRVPVRWAQACDPANRVVGAAPWPFLRSASTGELSSSYTLDGRPTGAPNSSPAYVGAAGAATAAGDDGATADLLDRAQAAEEAYPSYYGAAWVALGRVMLTTDWLGACP